MCVCARMLACFRVLVGVGARALGCACACRFTYTVCHAQAPYCLRPLWLHRIFRHYLINGAIFGKTKSLNIKGVF